MDLPYTPQPTPYTLPLPHTPYTLHPVQLAQPAKDESVVQTSNTSAENWQDSSEFSSLREPALLQAAQQIYRSYYESNARTIQRPIGVVINQVTYRGRAIFSDKPILLFQETFVPLNEIESEIY